MSLSTVPDNTNETDPLTLRDHFVRFFALVVFAVVFGYGLPTIVALSSDLFVREDMVLFLQKSGRADVVEKYNTYQQKRTQIENAVSTADVQLTTAPPEQRSALLSQRESYIAELKTLKPPVSIQHYNGHLVTYFWPVAFLCFGCVAFIISPSPSAYYSPKQSLVLTTITTICIYIMLIWATWVRNFALRTPTRGRVVYAYSNFDISRLGFLIQNLQFLIFSALLATIWVRWASLYELRKRELSAIAAESPLEVIGNPAAQSQLSRTLLHWQVTFAIVSLGFIFFTSLYWNQVIRNHDFRFVFEAIFEHIVWVLTGIITAMPLFITWRSWHSKRLEFVGEMLRCEPSNPDIISAKLDALRELRPIGSWNIAASVTCPPFLVQG